MSPSVFAPRNQRRLLLVSVLTGLAYGLLGRLVFGHHVEDESLLGTLFPAMSVAFLFLVPFGLGFLVVWIGERESAWHWSSWLVIPWVPAYAALLTALALAWEGLICIVLWAPLVMILSSLGGLAAGLWRRWFGRRPPATAWSALCCCPSS